VVGVAGTLLGNWFLAGYFVKYGFFITVFIFIVTASLAAFYCSPYLIFFWLMALIFVVFEPF